MVQIGEPAKQGQPATTGSPPGQRVESEGDVEVQFVEIRGLYRPGYSDRSLRQDRRPIRCGYQIGYASLDNRGRIFINHRPRHNARENWQRARRKNQQYIHAIVRVLDPRGSLPASARIEWEWEDPDDPADAGMHAAAARRVDPVSGADNLGFCDHPLENAGNTPAFEAVSGFAGAAVGDRMRTAIVGGRSQVKMHCTNMGGDNYRLRARLIGGPSPQATVRTGLMTMWKRIDVEYRRMRSIRQLPVDQVARAFAVANVQLDFTVDIRITHRRDFVTSGDLEHTAAVFCRDNFRRLGQAGWFFIAACDMDSSQVSGNPPRQVYPTPPRQTAGGTLMPSFSGGGTGQCVSFNALLPAGVNATMVELHDGGRSLSFAVSATKRNWPRPGMTAVSLAPLRYHPRPVPLNGSYERAMSGVVEYLPGTVSGYESMGLGPPVQCNVWTGYSIGAAGVTPVYPGPRSHDYFAGRSVVFMGRFSNQAQAVRTTVHELCHAFGFPHNCGRRSVRGGNRGCPMAILNYWLFRNGTNRLDRWSFAASGPTFCEEHLNGLRRIHLEDNPVMWTRWPT